MEGLSAFGIDVAGSMKNWQGVVWLALNSIGFVARSSKEFAAKLESVKRTIASVPDEEQRNEGLRQLEVATGSSTEGKRELSEETVLQQEGQIYLEMAHSLGI
jgi:hypothetical protein